MDKPKSNLERILIYLGLSLVGLIFLSPFLYMVSISLASDATNAKGAFTLLPKEYEWKNYIRVFTGRENMGLYIWNSVKLSLWCIAGQVLASSFVAFGFARLRARGNKVIFLVLLATMMIPQDVYIIPQFMLFKQIGWIDTYLPMIVPNFAGGAFNIFLLRQFFMSVPISLDEAAKIDGLSYFGIYSRIILPLMKPILIAIALFTFQFNWGWFYGPLVFLQDSAKYPLAVALRVIQASQGNAVPNWHYVMVGSVFLTIPPLMGYFFGQKYMLEANITAGSSTLK